MRRGIASTARRGWLKRGANAPAAPDRRWQMALAASVLLPVALGLTLSRWRAVRSSTPCSSA